jgi:hypothetical protein
MVYSDIGSDIKVVRAIAPHSNSGSSSVNGPSIDRLDYASAVLFVDVGATSGNPTSFTVDCKLQESDDGSTWADITGASIATITTANTQKELNVDLRGRKRYIRAVLTASFSGGSSPTVLASAALVLGGANVYPI